MKILWISRSNKPNILSISQFFLSLTTGIVFTAHFKYLSPLIVTQNSYSFQNSILFLVIASLLKIFLLLGCLRYCRENRKGRQERRSQRQGKINQGQLKVNEGQGNSKEGEEKGKAEQEKDRKITLPNLIYPGLIKTVLYLSTIMLFSGGLGLDVTIVSMSTLGFVCWLLLCSGDNPMAKRILKGRNFSNNPVKIILMYLLVLVAFCLQPQQYIFSFQLHFQIFIIFITAFLIFSYFYIRKLIASFSTRQATPKVLCQQSLCELFSLLLIWLYYIVTDRQGLSFLQQIQYLLDQWHGLIVIAVLCTLYEMVLWEHIKKVAISQLAITLSTGFLWFNIYLMAHNGIDITSYISVVLMIAVLMVNIGLLSEDNRNKISRLWAVKKKKRQHLEQENYRDDQQ